MIVCSSGLYISYQFNLYGIHQHQKELILHSSDIEKRIVTFSFPINFTENKNIDVRFVEDDEIMIDGKMYDIVSQYTSADSIMIKCISDKTEDEIRSGIASQVNTTEGATTQKNLSVFKFISKPFTTAPGPLKFKGILKSSPQIFLSLKDKKPIICYLNVPSPPPWYCV